MTQLDDAIKTQGGIKHPLDVVDVIFDIFNKPVAKPRPATVNGGYETSVVINGYEYPAIIGYVLIPFEKGDHEGDLQLSPSIPAHIEIESVQILDGKWGYIDLPEQSMGDILAEILEEEIG